MNKTEETLFALILTFILCTAGAEIEAAEYKGYVSAGLYHLDCGLTSPLICDDELMGSQTPGTLGVGVRVKDCGWWCLSASNMDIGWHHQSYLDRGKPFNSKSEAQVDMFGIRFDWEFNITK